MKKLSIFILIAFILSLAVIAYSASGRLVKDANGNVITGFVPLAAKSKVLGTKSFKNFTTSTLAAIAWSGQNGVTETAVKVRLGGFSTGLETDYFSSPGNTIWLDNVPKIGFMPYSSANSITVHTLQQ